MNQANHTKKIRVAVLYGGRSAEHEVSLNSAMNVIQNLDRSRFEVVPIGIDQEGSWYLGDDVKQLESSSLTLHQNVEKMLFTPSLIGKKHSPTTLVSHHHGTDRIFDVVFPAIHGPLCEDGTVQGLLELADIPYVGCGVLASAVGMDKDVSKRLVSQAGFRVPSFFVIKEGQWQKNPGKYCSYVEHQLGYPVFVKPSNTGSSIGIRKVKEAKDLVAAIENAFLYDSKVLVEQSIDAIELELSVLESKEYGVDPIVSVVGEIKPSGHEFYSYEAKYIDEHGAELIIPAPISSELQLEAQRMAKNIFMLLECEGMARVDLFLERGTNRIYFNEINTIPGFTQISMYPKLMNASGVSYQELLSHLIDLSIERHARRNKLIRAYVVA